MRSRYLAASLLFLASCSGGTGDPPSVKVLGPPVGDGKRIREVANPDIKDRPGPGSEVTVTGVTVVAVDNFDETGDGKSRGTIYIQDANSKAPFSGISLYAPSFVPADLRVAPGDVLDFTGPYAEVDHIGAAVFAPNVLVQLNRPIGTYRFDGPPPEPVDIDVNDLLDYNVGRKWVGMLVRAKNVSVQDAPFPSKGRLTACIGGDCGNNKSNPPQISNELYDLQMSEVAGLPTFESVTGIVTFFFSLKIAPRSSADLVLAKK